MQDAKPRILVAAAIPPELRAILGARLDLIEKAAGLADAPSFRVALTTSVGGADQALMDALPNLGLLACMGAGLERIDLDAAAQRGIQVRHTPDAVTTDTADGAVALLYAASRRVAEADRFVRAGRWGKERMTPSRRVSGRRAGVVGLGRIGSLIAERLSGIGMQVSYTGPRPKSGVPWPYRAGVGELADHVDALVLSCPGGEATRHLVDADVLRRLGKDGILVNVSRGSVVDEEALIAALKDGTIAGAGLDVFAEEPGLDPRFAALENVVLQPHYAAVTHQTRADMAAALLEEIGAFLGAGT